MKIDNELEKNIAMYFAPTYHSSSEEYQYLVELEQDPHPKISLCHPPWKPFIHYSIFKWAPFDNHDFYEINYLSIWDRDTGVRGHLWDTERTAILVKSPMGSTNTAQFDIYEIYYAAHEGEGLLNRSKYLERSKDEGIEIYWSLSKHGSYPALKDAKKYQFIEGFKEPGSTSGAKDYILTDAGSIDHPVAPWIKYEEPWGPDDVSSIYSKLKDRIWSPITGTSKWKRNLPGEKEARKEIRKFQSALNLKTTGNLNLELYEQVNTLPREVIRNSRIMDENIIAQTVALQPKQLDGGQVAATFDVPTKSLRTAKTIEGDIDGISDVRTMNLGKIDSKTILYGLIDPNDEKIFAIKKAPLKTIKGTKITSRELKDV